MPPDSPLPGVSVRVVSGSIPVVRVYYHADPRKNPATPIGRAWLDDAITGYPGGEESPRWRKEMLIEYYALGGSRLFGQWERWTAAGHIVIPSFMPSGYRLFGSYDHGWRNPAAFHVHAVSSEGKIVTVWEFYASQVGVPHIAKIIRGEPVRLSDGRQFSGNPYAGKLTWIVADPEIWAEDQPMNDNTMKSIAHLFGHHGVHFQAGERGGDTTIAEWLTTHYWLDPERPLYRITAACPKLIWELGQLRYKELSSKAAMNRETPEQLVGKNDHAWDSLKYFLHRFPVGPKIAKPEKKPDTFAWWRQQALAAKKGRPATTFRREMVG